jgi:hypothetical protein
MICFPPALLRQLAGGVAGGDLGLFVGMTAFLMLPFDLSGTLLAYSKIRFVR